MARRLGEGAARDLARVFDRGAAGQLSDRELLERFLRSPGRAGEEAFSALVERHGPTVLTVCRRMLADAHEAEDAFQATFLVLARKARAISGRERVGNWLYGVALRVSREGKRRADRRARRERLLGDDDAGVVCSSASVGADAAVEELRSAVVEELSRLPDRYRGPLLLCDLEGRSRREAAERLGLPEGTVSSRLARGRELLRGRLVRRGLAPATLIGAMGGQAKAFVPASLVTKAAEAAGAVAWRGVAAGAVPAAVSGLAGEVIRTMFLMKLKAGMLAVAAVGAATTLAIGGAWAISPRGGGPPVEVAAIEPPAPIAEDEPEEADSEWPIARGVVVDEEGRPVAGAEVEVIATFRERTSGATDAEGRFAIRARSLTLASVLASADDGARMGFASVAWNREAEVLRIVLKPSVDVVARVTDESGEPVADAVVEVLNSIRSLDASKTDGEGLASFRLPPDAPVEWIIGFHPREGFDYAEIGPSRNQTRPAGELSGEVPLVLDGARTFRIRAVDHSDEPIAGVWFYPWVAQKPGKANVVNLGGSRFTSARTDGDGIATFDWLPAETTVPIIFNPMSEDLYAPERTNLEPEDPSGLTRTAVLLRMGTIAGRVTRPDGSPAEGVRVRAQGEGAGFGTGFRDEDRTAADGSFVMKAAPQQSYVVGIDDEEWAAPSHVGVGVGDAEKVEGLDFTLGRGAVIRGTVTFGHDGTPAEGKEILVIEDGGPLPEELDPDDGYRHRLQLFRSDTTGPDGSYRLRVGPGSFTLQGPLRTDNRELEVEDGDDHVVDFVLPRPETGTIEGRVVLASEPSRGVAGAIVRGVSNEGLAVPDMTAVTDDEGRFRVERWLDVMTVFTKSPDGSLAGIVDLDRDAESLTIPIGPTASATGIAMDESGGPLSNRALNAGVLVSHTLDDSGAFSYQFSPEVTTDEEGRFTLPEMAVGHSYTMSHYDGEYFQHIATITPVEPGEIDLGTVKVGSPRPGQEDAMSSFRRDAPDAGDDAPAVEATTLEEEPLTLDKFRDKYVLIDFWATWCGPCIAEIPTMEAVFAEFGADERFVMLSLSIDEEIEAPRAFQADRQLPWAQGFVGEGIRGEVLDAFGVRAIPALVLVGPDGTIVARGMRGEQIREEVAKALGDR